MDDINRRPLFVGLFSLVAVGGLSTLLSATANYSAGQPDQDTQAAMVQAEYDLEASISNPGSEVVYEVGAVLSPTGRVCLHNPVVVGQNNSFLAMIGRINPADPNTVVAAVMVNKDRGHETLRVHVHWSSQLGSFVTANNVMVGFGEIMAPGQKCSRV